MEQIKLPRLSASKLKLYQECPKLYLNRYRDREDGSNIWASIGSAVHKAIEMYYRDGTSMYATFLYKCAAINPMIKGYDLLETLQHTMLHGLNNFDPSLYPVLEVNGIKQLEKHFRLPYPAINPICTLEGYMDHITMNGFIDYKTGKDKVSKKALKNDLQFAVYFWAYEQLYNRKPDYGIYYRIRDNKEIRITEVNDILDSAVRTMLADPMIYDDNPCATCKRWCSNFNTGVVCL